MATSPVEFKNFTLALFNAIGEISPREAGDGWLKAFEQFSTPAPLPASDSPVLNLETPTHVCGTCECAIVPELRERGPLGEMGDTCPRCGSVRLIRVKEWGIENDLKARAALVAEVERLRALHASTEGALRQVVEEMRDVAKASEAFLSDPDDTVARAHSGLIRISNEWANRLVALLALPLGGERKT